VIRLRVWTTEDLRFTTASRSVLEPTQSPIEWVLEFLSESKAAGAWSWLLTSI